MSLDSLSYSSRKEIAVALRHLNDEPDEPCRGCGGMWAYVLTVGASLYFQKTHYPPCIVGRREEAWINPPHTVSTQEHPA